MGKGLLSIAVLAGKKPKMGDEPDEDEESYDDELEEAAAALLDAIKAKDPTAVAEALKAAHVACKGED